MKIFTKVKNSIHIYYDAKIAKMPGFLSNNANNYYTEDWSYFKDYIKAFRIWSSNNYDDTTNEDIKFVHNKVRENIIMFVYLTNRGKIQ